MKSQTALTNMPSVAGYSGKPLAEKLGIKPASSVLLVDPPDYYRSLLEPLPQGVIFKPTRRGPVNLIQYFVTEKKALEKNFKNLRGLLADRGMLWISWPKKASGKATELDENIIRGIGLKHGMVDIKVCAVDEIWSGLKFVERKA